jgi:hypothetical protein
MLIRIRSDQTGDDKRFIADDLFVTHPMRQCNVGCCFLLFMANYQGDEIDPATVCRNDENPIYISEIKLDRQN